MLVGLSCASSGRLRGRVLLLTAGHSPAQQGDPSCPSQPGALGSCPRLSVCDWIIPGPLTPSTGLMPGVVVFLGWGQFEELPVVIRVWMLPLGAGCQVMKPFWTKGLLATGADPLQPELVGTLQVPVVAGSLVSGEDLVRGQGR